MIHERPSWLISATAPVSIGGASCSISDGVSRHVEVHESGDAVVPRRSMLEGSFDAVRMEGKAGQKTRD